MKIKWSILCLFALAVNAAHGQIYVSSIGPETAGEYNATTGAVVNASLVTGLGNPYGIAISGSNLYVANYNNGTIAVYNANTGAVVNAALVTGLGGPDALAISGPNVYVANYDSNTIGEYNAMTGAVVNASLVTGLNQPYGIAIYGSNLYVTNFASGTIGEYNVSTGAAVNASLITGLNTPYGLTVFQGNIYVANYNDGTAGAGTIGEYNATTGAAVNASFLSGLTGPDNVAGLGSNLYVASYNNGTDGTVGEYNATTGAIVNASLISGLAAPSGLVVLATTGESSQTITFPAITNRTYGAAQFVLSATATSGLPVSYSLVSGPATLSGTNDDTVTVTGVGTVVIEASQAGNSTYAAAADVTQSFMVGKAALTVAVNSGGHSTYGSTPIDPSITVTSGTLYNGDTLASIGLGDSFSSLNLNSASSAGTFTINVTGASGVTNYTVTTQSATYTINQATQTINFTIANQVFPSSPLQLSGTTTSGLAVSYGVVSGSATLSGTNNSILTLTGTGSVTIQANQAGNSNYIAALPVDQTFTVTASPNLTLTQWEAQYFNSTQMGNAAISGPTATPEGDGIPNLLKYVYNINPAQPVTTAEKAMLPVVVITGTTETLTYYQYSLLTGVSVEVQTSPDLQTWTTVSNTNITRLGTDGSDAIMQAQVMITPPREFIRLIVTQQP